ncbi:hypothetical protein BG003_004033 [Podila horticola]|nr:hypothetical protein BG003_004033 [Podila horticola]
MSDQQNPLSIPELLLQVSEYFESKEAAVPRAVCRAWNEVFSNRVWERCLPSRDTYYMEGALHPPSECLVENAHQLRKLVCNARTTNLQQSGGPRATAGSERPPGTVRSSLLSCKYDGASRADPSTRLSACSVFHNASFHGTIVQDLELRPKLCELGVAHTAAILLLRLCPGIHSLRLVGTAESSREVLLEVARLIHERHFWRLDSLTMFEADDRALASCLHALDQDGQGGHLKKIKIEGGVIEDLSFKALEHHFVNIRCVDCIYLDSSKHALTILEFCPLLSTFTGPELRAKEVIQSKPWICASNLKHLSIGIVIDETGEGAVQTHSQDVFKRLSQLTRLNYLHIDLPLDDENWKYRYRQGLDMTLQSGLGQLWTLKNLRGLDISGTVQNMQPEDVAWIGENWKQLRWFHGRCNHHGEYRDQPGARPFLN